MDCRRCGSDLERPGDYCLACDTANCHVVVADFDRDRARLTFLFDPAEADAEYEGQYSGGERPGDEEDTLRVVGETVVTTVPEEGDEEAQVVELRNFAGRVADEIRRKRPEAVYAAGARGPLRECRAQLHYEFYRVPDEAPVEHVVERQGGGGLEVVEAAPREKLGGSHTTLIGERDGWEAISAVAEHPHVKKVIPGPIDASGQSARGGLRAKVTRADGTGNVRLLLRDGASVQENRVVTTATNREDGERVREDLNEALEGAGFGGE